MKTYLYLYDDFQIIGTLIYQSMNEFDHCILVLLIKQQQQLGLNRDLNPELCNAGRVLYQLSYQANWEQVIMSKNE